jgi:hypothetical protein
MRGIFLVAGLALAGAACGQALPVRDETRRPVRIPIRYADPYAVRAMIEGVAISSPEMSTLALLMGTPAGPPVAAGIGFLRSGRLMVNPTDNSLWWIPGPPVPPSAP